MPDDSAEPLDPPRSASDRLLLDVRLRPHRSLSSAQFRILMCFVALVGTVSSLPFVIAGAWPVGGFMGLDVLVVYLAFRASFRSARAYEEISVTPLEMLLAKVTARGQRAEWRFHPAWVRVQRVEHQEFGLQRLSVRERGRSVEVAGFLGADAKAVFASELTRALAEARRGPQFSS